MDERVYQLLKKEKVIQKSEEWLSKRQTMITASSASDLLLRDDTCDPYIKEFNLQDTFLKDSRCCNPYSSKNQFQLRQRALQANLFQLRAAYFDRFQGVHFTFEAGHVEKAQ